MSRGGGGLAPNTAWSITLVLMFVTGEHWPPRGGEGVGAMCGEGGVRGARRVK